MHTVKKRYSLTLGFTALLLLVAWNPVWSQDRAYLVCDIWPPYQVQTGKGVTGYSTKLITKTYERLGLPTPIIRSYPWKRALQILKSGEATGLFSISPTPERAQYAHHPVEPLTESHWIIWSLDKTPINSLEDLKGLNIGVVSGYSYTDGFWTFIRENCAVDPAVSDEGNFKKLARGRIDVTVAEYDNGIHLVHHLGLPDIKPREQVEVKRDGLYIMFNRNDVTAEFVKEFSRELKAFKQTAEFKTLHTMYFNRKNRREVPKCMEPFRITSGSAR